MKNWSLKEIADREAETGIHIKIVETGGNSVISRFQKSNSTETPGCVDPACLPCKSGRREGGSCRGCGINYQLECQLCPGGQRSLYIGESVHNLYTRGYTWKSTGRVRRHRS